MSRSHTAPVIRPVAQPDTKPIDAPIGADMGGWWGGCWLGVVGDAVHYVCEVHHWACLGPTDVDHGGEGLFDLAG